MGLVVLLVVAVTWQVVVEVVVVALLSVRGVVGWKWRLFCCRGGVRCLGDVGRSLVGW